VGSRQRQMAFEEDTVEAMQGANDEAGELDQKAPWCGHDILPRMRMANRTTSHYPE
jgi:hypothetical protein